MDNIVFYYMNALRNELIRVDIIFNYAFMLDFQEHVFIQVIQVAYASAGEASAQNMYFPNFYKDVFLEVQHEECS